MFIPDGAQIDRNGVVMARNPAAKGDFPMRNKRPTQNNIVILKSPTRMKSRTHKYDTSPSPQRRDLNAEGHPNSPSRSTI
jgi:hypothetical protein